MSQASILKACEISPNLPNCYQVGCFAKRLTLFSQQIRAFNLAWALLSSGRVKPSQSVGVVGGGLAGMTIAAALAVKGPEVHLYERASDVLHIQRGNRIRYIHPTINDWPKTSYEDRSPLTLPYLVWRAGSCDDVANQIIRQWKLVESSVHVHPLCDVEAIQVQFDKIELTSAGTPASARHDHVVLAVGYGFERQIEGLPWRSYWQNDSLNQPVLIKQHKKFLVAGCGDGGFTDALRLRLKDFDHGSFLVDLAESYCHRMVPSLQVIESMAERLWKDKVSNGCSEHEAEEATRVFLDAEYKRLELPRLLLNHLILARREDTSVTINNSGPSYLTLKSAIVNRVAVHALVQLKEIEYLPGEPSLQHVTDTGAYVMRIEHAGGCTDREFDEVVVRQGTEPTINLLIPSDDLARQRAQGPRLADEIGERIFFGDFWKDEFLPAKANLILGDSALDYVVWFLIREGLDRAEIDAIAADAFVEALIRDRGFTITKITDEFLGDLKTRVYHIQCGADSLQFTVSTLPNWNPDKYDLALCFSTESKPLLDAVLHAQVYPYARLQLTPRGSLLNDLVNAGATIGDLSITTIPDPYRHIVIERRKGMFNAHRYATVQTCIESLTDRYMDGQSFYNDIVTRTSNLKKPSS